MTPLLAQFLAEARDLLEEADKGLLSLEQDPGNAESINHVFRVMHTIKGGAGLFPYESITRVVHAAEDVLVEIRGQELPLTSELIDLLLQCVDRVGSWLECIAQTDSLPASARGDGDRLAGGLRAFIQPPTGRKSDREARSGAVRDRGAQGRSGGEAAGPTISLRAMADLPPALQAAAAEHRAAGPMQALRYTPDSQCFFAGEDPLLLVRKVPGLLALEIRGPEAGWSPVADLDPYRCELRFELLSSAPRGELEEHFQHVASEVEISLVDRRLPTSPPAAAQPEGLRMRKSDRIKTLLKVDQSKVDLLMNLVGELVVAKNGLPYLARRAEQHYDVRALALEIKEQHAVLHRIADALQGAVMQIRMLPLSVVFERYVRLVRDLSRKLDKEVELITEGEDTEADKSTVDRLGDPLLHLVRNSIDHGIELPAVRESAGKRRQGTIRLRALRDGDRLVIEIIDDGRGLDPAALKRRACDKGLIDEARLASLSDQEALRLIFAPGFSTAEVISDVSGRGVGMDVVRRDIEGLGGSVSVHSDKGAGTAVRLTLPLTMSITRILTVQAGGEVLGVPMESVIAAVRVQRAAIRQMKQQEMFVWRDRLIPVVWLAPLLDLQGPGQRSAADGAGLAVLIVRLHGDEVGIVVDGFQEDIDIIIRPLEGILAGHQGYLGTAILGDGRALLVLNLREILTWRYDIQTATSSSAA